jgi:hypothetical protein
VVLVQKSVVFGVDLRFPKVSPLNSINSPSKSIISHPFFRPLFVLFVLFAQIQIQIWTIVYFRKYRREAAELPLGRFFSIWSVSSSLHPA